MCLIYYFFIMVVLGIVGYIVIIKKTKDKLNPFGLVCISWCIIAGIASLHLSWLETKWTLTMYFIVLIFPILVFLCGIVGKHEHYDVNSNNSNFQISRWYVFFTRFLGLICIICVLIEWESNGFIFTLFNRGAFDAKETYKAIPVIHYGTIYFPYCAIISIYELLYRKDKTYMTFVYNILIIVLNILYALLIAASRGTLLVIFCAAAYLFLRKYNIRLWKVLGIIIAALIAFVAMSRIRINEGSLVYDVIHGHPIISSVYGYTALSFENLNKLTQKGPAYTIISCTYGGFIQLLGLGRFFAQPEYITTYFFNSNTICYEFYEDLGIIGVVINTLLIFGVIRCWYEKSVKDSSYILLLDVLKKAIWMTFFGNYFTIYRVIVFPYIVTWMVTLSMKFDFSRKDGIKVLGKNKKEDKGEK